MSPDEVIEALRAGKAAQARLDRLLPICGEIVAQGGEPCKTQNCQCAFCRLVREMKGEQP